MMRIIVGSLLGLLVAYPALAELLTAAVLAAVSYPPLLVAAAGMWAWPAIDRTVRGWTR